MQTKAVLLISIFTFPWIIQCSSPKPIDSKYNSAYKEALLTTDFESLDELKKEIEIEYFGDTAKNNAYVKLTHTCNDRTVISILAQGVTESDFNNARKGSFIDRAKMGLRSPYAVSNRMFLAQVLLLARWQADYFGAGDIAFYDFAEKMVENISSIDKKKMSERELLEKGYLNTFNHILAQALITSIFSEEMADFVADVHERNRVPELATGHFTKEQLNDLDNGAVDNYVDMINNEWGQELGKELKVKYQITEGTKWTPELLSSYLNDVQAYFSWSLDIHFCPFQSNDEKIEKYALKMNRIRNEQL